MDEFCGNSSFWDSNLTWFNNNPDFTACFEHTILTWLPCGFLWLFGVIQVYSQLRVTSQESSQGVPMTPFMLSKALGSWVLASLQLTCLSCTYYLEKRGYETSPAERYSSILKIFSYIFTFILQMIYKAKGARTSCVLFLFWLFSVICEVFPFQTALRKRAAAAEEDEKLQINFQLQLINYPLIILMLLLNCWADTGAMCNLKKKNSGKKNKNKVTYVSSKEDVKKAIPCPEAKASFLSKLVFFWFETLAWKGYRNPLVYEDLWELNHEDLSATQYKIFEQNWKKAALTSGKNGVNVLHVLARTFRGIFISGAGLKLVQDCLTFIPPWILRQLICYVNNESDAESWKGYLYVGILFLTSIIQTIFLAQYFHKMFVLGMRIKAAVTSAVYRKALKSSNAAKKDSTTGEIVNLMSVDIQRLMDLVGYLNMLWSAPFQIGVSLYFLWKTLGPSVLSGIGVMVILIPLNGWFADKMKTLHAEQMKNKDGSMKLMNEILAGIKVLKLYAWEPSFEEKVHKIRDQEMVLLSRAAFFNALSTFMWFCAPFLVSLVTFATYVLIDEDNALDSEMAFVALALFNIMSMPMAMLPSMIVMSGEASVSLKRLGKYLNAEEMNENAVQHDINAEDSITIENGDFAWELETRTLSNINLRIKPGTLVAVVGTIGSGKSSLLTAILGELVKLKGSVVTNGSIAYVAQQAWIRNCTLRENILFGKPFDKDKYYRVINSCALQPDLDILPAGDLTEIGEKGVNLSGGQKQRVSLARSVYSDSDVVLLDDPLSAVDSHVGKHLFDKVLGQQGLLNGKTRVLVTHGINYLPQTDRIIVLKDGKISEEGTYKELLANKGAFSDFLVEHLNASELNDDDDDKNSELDTTIPTKTIKITQKQKKDINIDAPLKLQDKLIEVEKAETGSVSKDVYIHYFKAVGIRMVCMSLVFSWVTEAFQIGANAWLSKWSEEPKNEDGRIDVGRRNMYLGIFAAFGFAQSIPVILGSGMMTIGMLKASSTLHDVMLLNVLRSPISFFDTTPLGRIVNRFAKDVDVVDNQLPANIRAWLRCFCQVIGTIFVISHSTPIFLVAIVPLGAIYFLIQRFYVATSRQLKRLESITVSPIYSHFSETLTGTTTIRAYSKQNSFILESEEHVDIYQRSYFPSIVANRWLAVRLETIGNLIIFFAGLFAVLGREALDPGTVGLSISYALSITQTLNWLVRMTSEVETAIVAVERIKEYSETPQEAEWEILERKPETKWPEHGHITFEQYQTRYREGLDLVLRDITCEIKPGEKVGIVGRTGSGKSSLFLGLFRLIEAARGNIVIDGHNISKLGLHDVRSRITIIPQDPVLFSGTLRFNLDPFEKYIDDDIWQVLELAHLKKFVRGLTAGLSHEISEGGENLSVGERQLVCLARALLRKTKILVLDEATAAVDLETDDLIQGTIRKAFRECTVLTIAHRLNTIMDSTRVMVLDKGEIREFDSPSNLLQDKDTIFFGMAKDAGIVN